jgi:uncharacterized protein (DUF433 family)
MSREELARRLEEGARVISELAKRGRERITIDPSIMDGQPCVRGVPIADLVRLVAQEYSVETILTAYPGMTREDVNAALRFAADSLVTRYLVESGCGHSPRHEPELPRDR